jgi:hypothetical protein
MLSVHSFAEGILRILRFSETNVNQIENIIKASGQDRAVIRLPGELLGELLNGKALSRELVLVLQKGLLTCCQAEGGAHRFVTTIAPLSALSTSVLNIIVVAGIDGGSGSESTWRSRRRRHSQVATHVPVGRIKVRCEWSTSTVLRATMTAASGRVRVSHNARLSGWRHHAAMRASSSSETVNTSVVIHAVERSWIVRHCDNNEVKSNQGKHNN